MGAVDGVFVLEKDKRIGNKGKLTIANRDTEGFCFRLEFDLDKCKWLFVGNDVEADDEEEPICILIDDFVKESWCGTATELCAELKKIDSRFDCTPAMLTKRLKSLTGLFEKQ